MNFMVIFLMLQFYYLIYVKSYVLSTDNITDEQLSDKTFNDALKDRNIVIVKVQNEDDEENFYNKPILRINYDVETKNKRAKDNIVLQQHKARMKEINDFMKDHMVTTKYLYDEVKRIQRDRKVKDDLRQMVEYLEREENKIEKELLLKFFKRNKRIYSKKKINVWDQKTNDLVINVLNDPFNDGTIN